MPRRPAALLLPPNGTAFRRRAAAGYGIIRHFLLYGAPASACGGKRPGEKRAAETPSAAGTCS